MSLGCARCGDCCDPVGLSGAVQEVIDEWRPWLAEHPDFTRDDLDPSIPFAIAHWTAYEGPDTQAQDEIGDGHRQFRCDMFNTVTRLCEAHDERPPVCRIYPHEPEARGGALITRGLYNRCSYWLDVPAAERPEGIRPLIPLTVKGHP